MSPYKLRRCSICGKFHASYLVPDGEGGNLHYCYSCWKAQQAARFPETPYKQANQSGEQAETGQENPGTKEGQG